MGCNIKWGRNSSNDVSEIRFIMLGLDNSGKSSIMCRFKSIEPTAVTPTVGLSIEHITRNNTPVTIWDVGGQATMLWKHYYQNTQAVIFVVDSADKSKMANAKSELFKLLDESSLSVCPILIYCNKQDLPNALNLEQIKQELDYDKINRKNKSIQLCSALKNEGILEGFDKLIKYIIKDDSKLK